jgi:hypothetical protein
MKEDRMANSNTEHDHWYEWIVRSIDGVCDDLVLKHGMSQLDAVALIFQAAEEWHRDTLAALPEIGEGAGHA